jgi:hypothetical protein
MKKQIVSFSFVILCFTAVEGQLLEGYLVKEGSEEVIPYATFNFKGTYDYFITNEEGFFRYMVKKEYEIDSVIISTLGYEERTVSIGLLEDNDIVYLKQNIRILDELTVYPEGVHNPYKIIRDAKKAINDNYVNIDTEVEGYFRMYQKIDSNYTAFLDASVNVVGNSYASKSNKILTELIKTNNIRISNNFNTKGYENWLDTLFRTSNWIGRLLARDDVKYRNYLLDNSAKYSLKDLTFFNGRVCYEILVFKKPWHYVSTNSSSYDGFAHLIVDRENYKIYRLKEFESIDPIDHPTGSIWTKDTNDSIISKMGGGSRIVEYKFFNDRLTLSLIRETNIVFDVLIESNEVKHINKYYWDFFVNETFIPKQSSYESQEYVGMKEFNLYDRSLYNDDFWSQYNMIPPGKTTQDIFLDLSMDSTIEEQFKGRN